MSKALKLAGQLNAQRTAAQSEASRQNLAKAREVKKLSGVSQDQLDRVAKKIASYGAAKAGAETSDQMSLGQLSLMASGKVDNRKAATTNPYLIGKMSKKEQDTNQSNLRQNKEALDAAVEAMRLDRSRKEVEDEQAAKWLKNTAHLRARGMDTGDASEVGKGIVQRHLDNQRERHQTKYDQAKEKVETALRALTKKTGQVYKDEEYPELAQVGEKTKKETRTQAIRKAITEETRKKLAEIRSARRRGELTK
jgi:hypothetical protein